MVLFILLVGCTSHNDDVELMCKAECVKCEKVTLICKGDKVIKKIEIESG